MTKIVDLPRANSVTGNDLVLIYQDKKTKSLPATLLSGPPGPTGAQGPIGPTGATGPTGAPGITKPVREQLTSSRTYYVRTDGNDSNTGLSNVASGAFLTIQKAIDTASNYDLGGFTITIQVGPGTYTANINCKLYEGDGLIQLIGDTSNPANVILTASSGGIITSSYIKSFYKFSGFKLQGSSAIGIICVGKGSRVVVENMHYGALIYAAFGFMGGEVELGTCTISGNISTFVMGVGQATVSFQVGITITLTGTPNFAGQFASSDRLSLLSLYGVTFSGSATGKRFSVDFNSGIFVNGAGDNYLPGNVAGTRANGGIYS